MHLRTLLPSTKPASVGTIWMQYSHDDTIAKENIHSIIGT